MTGQLRYIAIVGSRSASREDVLNAINSTKLSPKHHVIVSGGANGADKWAALLGEELGFHVVLVPAMWKRGKGAGMARNSIIADIADAVIAVWDGNSSGTKDTIDKTNAAGKKLEIYAALGERTDYEAGKEAAVR